MAVQPTNPTTTPAPAAPMSADDLLAGLARIEAAAAASDPKARERALFAKSMDGSISADERREFAGLVSGTAPSPIAAAAQIATPDTLSKAQAEAAALGLKSFEQSIVAAFGQLASALEKSDVRRSDLAVSTAQGLIVTGKLVKGLFDKINALEGEVSKLSKALTSGSPVFAPSATSAQPRGIVAGGSPSGLAPIAPPVGDPNAQGADRPLTKGQVVKALDAMMRETPNGFGPNGEALGDILIAAHVTGDVPASLIPEIKKRLATMNGASA